MKTKIPKIEIDQRCGTHLPPTNTSKIHLLVEQFSLKTNWKLTERLLYNQGYQKDSQVIVQEEKDLYPWEVSQRKRQTTQAEARLGE